AAAGLLESMLDRHSAERRSLTVVATIPVMCGRAHRSDVLTVLDVLCPTSVVTIDSIKAAALGANADLSRAVLVGALGARLTEIGLLTDGSVTIAETVALGTEDLVAPAQVARLIEAVAEAVIHLMGEGCGPQVVDALDRGLLLTGGGALRAHLTYK